MGSERSLDKNSFACTVHVQRQEEDLLKKAVLSNASTHPTAGWCLMVSKRHRGWSIDCEHSTLRFIFNVWPSTLRTLFFSSSSLHPYSLTHLLVHSLTLHLYNHNGQVQGSKSRRIPPSLLLLPVTLGVFAQGRSQHDGEGKRVPLGSRRCASDIVLRSVLTASGTRRRKSDPNNGGHSDHMGSTLGDLSTCPPCG